MRLENSMLAIMKNFKKEKVTRLHSSRMRTARTLTVSHTMLVGWGWGGSAPGGGCLLPGIGGLWCLLPGGLLRGVSALGVSAPGGVSTLGGVYSWGGVR